MRNRLTQRNTLLARIENGTLSRRSRRTTKIDDTQLDFPELSLDDLRILFFGVYQIKQARPYVEEHLDDDGSYFIELEESDENILRCTIQSRHSNATRYKVWIQYSLIGDPIRAWYCTCSSGARTVGCCGHIASIIWYLSYARHHHFYSSEGRRRIQQTISETTEELGSEETDGEESDEDTSETDERTANQI